MNLLGAALYDPAGAVSKVTTSLLAQTAFDTTNLRIAFTVPAHGKVRVKMACVHHGSTTIAQVLLGILEGSTVRARVAPNVNLLQTAVATSQVLLWCDFTVSGLSAGAVNWDAAYGVEIVASANGAIKYGGPNDTTTNNAFGAFVFEIWDPQPLKTGLDGGVNVTQFGGSAGTFSGGRPEVNTTHLAGTAQTGRDIGASVLLSSGTGTGQVKLSSGYVAPNWGDVGNPSTSVNLSATTTNLVNTVTTYTGNTVQTGDSFARIGANGAGLTAIDLPDQTMNITGNITGNLSGSVGSVSGAVGSVTGAVGSVSGNVGGNVNGNVVGSVGSVTGLTASNLDATVSSRATQASVDTIDGIVDAILVDTAEIGAAGAGLTALGDARLDHLDADISSRMATFVYTVPDNASIGLIKVQTDKFTFSVANVVDANILAVNNITVDGAGTAGDPWGPV